MSETAIIVGAGNLGWHLAHALDKIGVQIEQVISRNGHSAKELAIKFGAYYGTEISYKSQADWVFLCTSDDQLETAAHHLKHCGNILIHCSGSTAMGILSPHNLKYGVLYPLQTLTKSRKIDFNKVPLLIEASDSITEKAIQELAERLSVHVRFCKSPQRQILHLAAVFANNFVNHLYQISGELASKSGQNPEILRPLFSETLLKALELGPLQAQTGPAKRKDTRIMEQHLLWLKENAPEYENMYRLFSDSISHKTEN